MSGVAEAKKSNVVEGEVKQNEKQHPNLPNTVTTKKSMQLPQALNEQHSASTEGANVTATPKIHLQTPTVKDTTNIFSKAIKEPFTFTNVNCWIPSGRQQILRSVSGYVKPGEMLAVMGPSGSGKTTMLNVLSQKLPVSQVDGSIRIGNHVVSKTDRRTMGFVFQDDLMLHNLTVNETVRMSAELKLPITMPTAVKISRVNSLLDILGLLNVKDSHIGSIGMRGISGGERKRTAVANELVTAPSILFLDEPTSGLDATTSLVLVDMLRKLCDRGMTIICCIHQPRDDIFQLFDRLLLLQNGRTAYFGAVSECHTYLESFKLPSTGATLKIPEFTTVADWILDLMSDETVAEDIADRWENNNQQRLNDEISKIHNNTIVSHSLQKASTFSNVNHDDKVSACNTWCHNFSTLVRRNFMQKRGNFGSSVVIVNVLVTAIIMGVMYWDSKVMSDIYGAIFFALMNQAYFSTMIILRLFPPEKSLMRRERSSNYYSLSSYFLSKIVVDGITAWISPIVFIIILYFCVGFERHASNFFLFLLLFVSHIFTAESFGLMISCMTNDVPTAGTINTLYLLSSMLVSGFYVDVSSVPIYLVWLKWIGLLLYSYTGLLKVQFEFNDPYFPCEDARDGQFGECFERLDNGSMVEVAWPNGSFSGKRVLESLTTPDISIGYIFLILWGMSFAFRLTAYLFLRYDGKGSRAQCCQKLRKPIANVTTKTSKNVELVSTSTAEDAPNSVKDTSITQVDDNEAPKKKIVDTDSKLPSDDVWEGKSKQAASTDDAPDITLSKRANLSSIVSPPFGTKRKGPCIIRKQLTNLDLQDPVFPITLDFVNVGYQVVLDRKTQKTRNILEDLTGNIKPGTLVALMGASGAGKTTLLNVLAQRYSGGKLLPDSQILYNGRPADAGLRSRFGFVFQDDLMLSRLTVRETITIAAELKLPPDTAKDRKIELIDNVISTLRLTKVADSIVGGDGMRGVSGGERKRTALATELITSPSILFLDEPTTGLDSNTALEVVRIFSDLCLARITVICSIHQPRSSIFQTFDELVLMHQGKMAYNGSIRTAVRHMEQVAIPGIALPDQTNVADWLLDLLESGYGQQVLEAWSSKIRTEEEESGLKAQQLVELGPEVTVKTRPQCFHQFKILMQRANKQEAGQLFNFVNGVSTMLIALVAGAVWWQSKSIDSLAGVLFFILINQSFMAVLSSGRLFPPQRNLMLRETSQGYYSTVPYFLAQTLYDSVAGLLVPILFVTVMYFMAGLKVTVEGFFTALGIMLLNVIAAQSLGILITCAIMDIVIATAVTAVLVLLLMLLGGFYLAVNSVPTWLAWMRYLSFGYWGYAALLQSEFWQGRPDILNETYSDLPLVPCSWSKPMEYGPCYDFNASGDITRVVPHPHGFLLGSTVVDAFGFSDVEIGFSCAMMAVLAIACRFLSWLALWGHTQPCCAYGCCGRGH
jgi:ABC-type multidrug transport system ATPase subunit/ABC-type multidrug transport system permease subunit